MLVQLIDRTLEDKSKDPLLLKVSQNGQFVLSETSLSAKEEARTREKDHAANANANAAAAPAPAPASEKEIDEVQRLAHQRRTQPLEKKKKLKILTTRDLEKIRERNPSPALISTFLCKTAHKTQVFPGAHAAEQIRRAREERFCKKRPR